MKDTQGGRSLGRLQGHMQHLKVAAIALTHETAGQSQQGVRAGGAVLALTYRAKVVGILDFPGGRFQGCTSDDDVFPAGNALKAVAPSSSVSESRGSLGV